MIKVKIATTAIEKAQCHELRKQVFVREQNVPIKLERICILPSHRGCNIGRLLIQKMEAFLLTYGKTCYRLSSQTQAINFYEKLGYSIISNRPYLNSGIWHVLMEKNY